MGRRNLDKNGPGLPWEMTWLEMALHSEWRAAEAEEAAGPPRASDSGAGVPTLRLPLLSAA